MLKINAAIISAMIICLTLAFIVCPKTDFSENENRSLADFPNLNIDDILDGSYMSDITAYISDHFPLRDEFVGEKNDFEIDFLGKTYINDIYIGSEGYYIEDYNSPKNTQRIIKNLNSFQDNLKSVKADFMLVPTQVSIYKDKLPRFAAPLSQLKTINEYYSGLNMNCINVYDILMEHKDSEQLYYRLDHHWTSDGAYYAYIQYCNEKNFLPVSRNDFNIEEIKDFKGTIYSKLNIDSIFAGEVIKIYENSVNVTVSYDGKESTSLYNMEYADDKDKYSVFLNNINSFIEITNNDINSTRTLAVAKDSYANCLIPFLVNHYKKIYVFDTRSYRESVSEFVNSHSIDDVLVLYNVNTIDTDTGINAIY